MKKPKIKTLRDKLEDLVRTYTRERDNNTCQKCGRHVEGSCSQPSHVIPKGRCLRLRYDPLNIKTLCLFHHRWWHDNPTESGEWFKKKFPKRWAYLEKHRYERAGFTREDYLRMIEKYET